MLPDWLPASRCWRKLADVSYNSHCEKSCSPTIDSKTKFCTSKRRPYTHSNATTSLGFVLIIMWLLQITASPISSSPTVRATQWCWCNQPSTAGCNLADVVRGRTATLAVWLTCCGTSTGGARADVSARSMSPIQSCIEWIRASPTSNLTLRPDTSASTWHKARRLTLLFKVKLSNLWSDNAYA
jgi:hypothetical protein